MPADPTPSVPAIRDSRREGELIVERLAAPTPGQYWRAQHFIKGRHDKRGSFNDVQAGTVLVLEEIQQASGEAHVIVLAPHPGWKTCYQHSLRIHADDFESNWERALDGDEVRAREMAQLIEQMRLTQEAMSHPPAAAETAAIGQQPALNAGSATGQELATATGLKAMTAHAEAIKARADRDLAWISRHSSELGDLAGALARFHQERATAMLAKAHNQLADLDDIRKLVLNLQIYTGAGVDVLPLVQGEPAARDDPLVIYQDLLSFDEELLMHLDQGGIDHTMVRVVGQALNDPVLVRQLIPSPRGMVLVRFRGGHKEFVMSARNDSPEKQSAIARFNEAMTRESMRHHLLYRDGASLTLISCDDVLPNIKQLLPSAAEQAEHYARKRFDYDTHQYVHESITREDIDYAKAQRSHLGRLTDFARVLIILWGLHDRTELLSKSSIPRFSNWLDPGFQKVHLWLVSLDSLIGEERPSFRDYQAEANRYLGAGTTIAVRLHETINESTAPGCFTYSDRRGEYDQVWRPVEPVVIARVSYHKGKACVSAVMKHQWDKGRTKTVRIELIRGFLVLDRADAMEMTYYLGSRASRRDYAEYVEIFRRGLAFVSDRDRREAPWVTWLTQAIADGKLQRDPNRTELAVRTALAVVRATTPAGALPDAPADASTALRNAALNAAHAALSDHGHRVAAIDAFCVAHSRKPLALVHDGRDRWFLYREASPAERDQRIGTFPWTVRVAVAFDGIGDVQVGATAYELCRHKPGEQTIHAWEGAEDWRTAQISGGLSHSRMLALLDLPSQTTTHLDHPADMVQELIDAAKEYNRTHTPGYVARLDALFPVGTIIRRGKTRLVAVTVDAWHAAYMWGDEAQRLQVRAWIQRTYRNPEAHLEKLAEPIKHWSVMIEPSRIPLKQKHPWLQCPQMGMDSVEDWKKRRKTASGEFDLRLTTLSPAGARLVPWLVPYCEATAVDRQTA